MILILEWGWKAGLLPLPMLKVFVEKLNVMSFEAERRSISPVIRSFRRAPDK